MTRYLLVFIATLFLSTDETVRPGEFSMGTRHGYIRLILNGDKTFEQKNIANYSAYGKWAINSDTLKLTAEKVYSLKSVFSFNPPKFKDDRLTDTSSYEHKQFSMYNTLIILDNDTLIQLYKRDENTYKTGKLKRKKG